MRVDTPSLLSCCVAVFLALVTCSCHLGPMQARPVPYDQVHFRIKQRILAEDRTRWAFYACGDMVVADERTMLSESATDYYDRSSGRLLAECGGNCMLGMQICHPCAAVEKDWKCEYPRN
jgi:hypothetical protein